MTRYEQHDSFVSLVYQDRSVWGVGILTGERLTRAGNRGIIERRDVKITNSRYAFVIGKTTQWDSHFIVRGHKPINFVIHPEEKSLTGKKFGAL